MNRTYVIGLWLIDGNPKHKAYHYAYHLCLTLKYLANEKVIFISDSEALNQHAKSIINDNNGKFYNIVAPISSLEKYEYRDKFLNAVKEYGTWRETRSINKEKEKGENHYQRDYLLGTDESYCKMLTVWHSKIDMLLEAYKRNPFSTEEICWVDASFSRFFEKLKFWDFKRIQCPKDGASLYPNGMRKHGETLKYAAPLLLVDASYIPRLKSEYDAAFLEYISEPYPNDEETILHEMSKSRRAALFGIEPFGKNAPAKDRYNGITGRVDRLLIKLHRKSCGRKVNQLGRSSYFA